MLSRSELAGRCHDRYCCLSCFCGVLSDVMMEESIIVLIRRSFDASKFCVIVAKFWKRTLTAYMSIAMIVLGTSPEVVVRYDSWDGLLYYFCLLHNHLPHYNGKQSIRGDDSP
ncbi:hypothetical protein VNO77_19270 [Canavalia gladiata]|uniref:Uncharacterized protein n=1 Tax=Canavalia gladiata TaxID=3824 RepID=A0AAN9LS97_CANGL